MASERVWTSVVGVGLLVAIVWMIGNLLHASRQPRASPATETSSPDSARPRVGETPKDDAGIRRWMMDRLLIGEHFLDPDRIAADYQSSLVLMLLLFGVVLVTSPVFGFRVSLLNLAAALFLPVFIGQGLIPYLMFYGLAWWFVWKRQQQEQ